MKKFVYILIFVFVLQEANAQVETNFFPKGNAFEHINYIKHNIEVKKL